MSTTATTFEIPMNAVRDFQLSNDEKDGCLESDPCQHPTTIFLVNGENFTVNVPGTSILRMSRLLNKNISTHFFEYADMIDDGIFDLRVIYYTIYTKDVKNAVYVQTVESFSKIPEVKIKSNSGVYFL